MSDITTNPTNDPEFDVHDEEEVQAIEEFDFQRAFNLLQLVEKVATVAPKSTAISGIALAEIDILNNKARDIARARAEKAAQAEQRRYEAEQARVRREAEAAEGAQENAQEAKDAYDDDHAEAEQVEPPPQPGQPSPSRRII